MNDNLNERAAVCLGWRWMKYQAPNYSVKKLLTGLHPPAEMCSIEAPNDVWKHWEPSDEHAERFSNWNEPIWWDLDGEYQRGVPQYTTDRNAAHLLLEEVGRRGLQAKLTRWFENNPAMLGFDFATIEMWNYWLLTAPLEILVQAAVEVLEAE